MLNKDTVREMMIDPSKIVIPRGINKFHFADLVVSNLWDTKCPVEQDLLVKGFYKILLHPNMDVIIAMKMMDDAHNGTSTITEAQASNALVYDHVKEFRKFGIRVHGYHEKERTAEKKTTTVNSANSVKIILPPGTSLVFEEE